MPEAIFPFELTSLHPSKTPLQFAAEIEAALPEIAKELSAAHAPVTLELEQARTFPGDQETLHFVIKCLVQGAFAGLGGAIAKDLWEKLKSRFKNARITPDRPPKEP